MAFETKNVILCSAGRRVSLLRNLRRAAQRHHPGAKVFAIDMRPELSAACQSADGWAQAPRVTDTAYLSFLAERCQAWDANVVVPTIDPELPVLAAAREDFLGRGIELVVPDAALCSAFSTKRGTEDAFGQLGAPTPAWLETPGADDLPLFAKRDDSSCSIGAQRVESPDVLRDLIESDAPYVFQQLIEGEEFTCDIFFSKRGEPLSVVPRQRLFVRAGEVNKARAVKDQQVIEGVLAVAKAMQGARGVMNIQVMRQNGELYFIEVNTRFGGGYPLSVHAGADMAQMLFDDLNGQTLAYDENWRDGTLMLRYDDEVIVQPSAG